MKKFFYICSLAVVALGFTACETSDTEGLTDVTYYPMFTLEGGKSVSLAIGQEYTDEFTCTFKGQDITSDAEVTIVDMYGDIVNAIKTDAPNVYTVYYYAVAENGREWEDSRTIFVFDPTITVTMEGSYDVDMKASYRFYGSETTYHEDATSRGYVTEDKGIKMTQLCPGIFRISDLLAGWYDKHRGYDQNYKNYDFKLGALLMLQADNTITLLSSSLPYWGYEASAFEGSYDPETGKLTYMVTMEEMDFYVFMQNDDEKFKVEPKCPNCGGTGCQGDCNM